jgi:hypothetical protein
LKKIARDTGCCCSGCQRKSDRIIDLILEEINKLGWQDEDSYHAKSHQEGYFKAIKDINKLFEKEEK